MKNASTLAREALRAALETRAQLKIDRAYPVCPFDAADRLGVEVKFRDETSMDGMYVGGSRPTILVGTHRSSGRRSITCAHELGHHVFKHGTSVDEVLDEHVSEASRAPEERLANLFAGFFLMPKAVVEGALRMRALEPEKLTPLSAFRVASFLGVSFGALANHMRFSLDMISAARLKELLRAEPKALKTELAGGTEWRNVWPVDEAWVGRSVDVEVGDLLLAPLATGHEGNSLARSEAGGKSATSFVATKPGISRLSKGGWNVFVRIQRAGYIGRSLFRHDEDPDAS